MRRIFSILVGILFVASFAAAQTAPATGQTSTQPKAKSSTSTKPASHQLTGEVVKADASSITVKPSKGAEESFVLGTDTKIMQGTKTMMASDLKAGERVTVHYTKTGNEMTATHIAVAKPKPASSETKKEPKEPKQ
jgi:hypothetical protein